MQSNTSVCHFLNSPFCIAILVPLKDLVATLLYLHLSKGSLSCHRVVLHCGNAVPKCFPLLSLHSWAVFVPHQVSELYIYFLFIIKNVFIFFTIEGLFAIFSTSVKLVDIFSTYKWFTLNGMWPQALAFLFLLIEEYMSE